MKTTKQNYQSLPSEEEISLARSSAEELSRLLDKLPKADRARVHMGNQDLIFPRQALELLREILVEMAQGHIAQIVPTHHLLTTQEAADILNVSRPYLIQLLEKAELPFSKVGTHRRIRYEDLMEYKEKSDQESERLLAELVKHAQENDMGY